MSLVTTKDLQPEDCELTAEEPKWLGRLIDLLENDTDLTDDGVNIIVGAALDPSLRKC